jgi:hypothetical protein
VAGGYTYAAVRPQYDDDQRVIAFELWAVQCGPLPEPARSARSRRGRGGADKVEDAQESVTDRPFPGLTVVDSDCVAESADALRRAAVLSESLGKSGSHWVRDGWR